MLRIEEDEANATVADLPAFGLRRAWSVALNDDGEGYRAYRPQISPCEVMNITHALRRNRTGVGVEVNTGTEAEDGAGGPLGS